MTAFLEQVRGKIDRQCLTDRRLIKEKCSVSMVGVPEAHLVIDFDKPGSPLDTNATRCDYLLIAQVSRGDHWVVPIELKRGKLHADHVVRQLRAGASAAERLIRANEPVLFRPVAATGISHKRERGKLREKGNAINFHGNRERVRLISCGARLASAIRL